MTPKRKLKTYLGKEDIKDAQGCWIKSYPGGFDSEGFYIMNSTISGRRWCDMIKRCKPDSYTHINFPSYVGCENRFQDFDSFVNWSMLQEGYSERDKKGSLWQLDKDLILKHNKIYSEDTCVFIPGLVNRYFVNANASRGDFPIGVGYNKVSGKYQAYCHTGKSQFLGAFNDPTTAHRAWQKAKVEYGNSLNAEFKTDFPKLFNYFKLRIEAIEKDYREGLVTIF